MVNRLHSKKSVKLTPFSHILSNTFLNFDTFPIKKHVELLKEVLHIRLFKVVETVNVALVKNWTA